LSQTELEDLKKIIDSEILKEKNERLSNQIDNYFIRAIGSVLFVFEKEKIHVFNRFYLLFSLVFSMVIPL
jgi:hypothetical protein